MAITLNSYNEILGKLIRKMIADTPVNDINRGSVLLTLLEAVASQDFENSTNILSVLESLSIDALKNSDLDQRAADYGLTRNSATRATGFIKISDSSITKRSTSLYAMKQPPIAGSTVVYVNDAQDWNQSGGYLYIGRGTQQFEGPIEYSSIIDNGSFYTIILSSAVQNDHLISDSVVDAQGTIDRIIPSGTIVKIPSNSQNPEILYSTLRDAILPAGEDYISNISILANQVGSSSNTGINTIVQFSSLPFSSATVTNYTALIDGKETESDDELRERIKSYTSTLARGTREAILSSIIGVSDSSDGKQVSSATITEPASVGEPSLVYIDDGSGFQPSFNGQSVDVILASATGGEEFLQLANFPLPRPQVVNLSDGPYSLIDQSTLSVLIDDKEEQITFESSQFSNIASATLQEVVNAINDQSETFKCRLTNNSSRLLIYPVDHDVEFIQVKENTLNSSELYANTYLNFPTNKYSYITLYKNNELLSEKESSATLRTTAQSNWGITSASEAGLIIEVDGTPAQSRGFDELDFGGQSFNTLTVTDWVSVLNKKFAGIRATSTSSDQIEISSNLVGPESSLRIVGGDYSALMFSGMEIYAEGKTSDFSLNRQTGNIQLKTTILAGDSITAGSADTKGNIISASSTGSFNLTSDAYGRSAELVIIADGNSTTYRSEVNPVIGTTIIVTALSGSNAGKMEIKSNTKTLFANAQVDDYVYLTYRGSGSNWLPIENCGLYKISSKGGHTTAGTDTWICVNNLGATSSAVLTIQSSDDIKVFSADSYPQIWKSSYLTQPGSATVKSIVDSIKSNTENIKSSIYKTSYVKLTSSTENDGSVATPVSIGSMSNVFTSGIGAQLGNQSNIANKTTQKDLISYFKMSNPSSQYVHLNRYTYGDLSTRIFNSITNPSTNVSETLNVYKHNNHNFDNNIINSSSVSYDDIVNVTSGSNKSHFRNIQYTTSYLSDVQTIQTQVELPNTIFDYNENDSINLLESLNISADDSIVFILDGDSVNKTINVNFWRTGKVYYNNGFTATNNQFSALDADNESNISFSNLEIWSKTNTNTEFKDYAIWFRSRNWYVSNEDPSAVAALIIRAKEYGPSGDSYNFNIEYPSLPDQDAQVKHINSPDETTCTYTFASDSEIVTGITGGTQFSVTKTGTTATLKFKQTYVDFSSLNPAGGDIISITDPGVDSNNRGVFRINSFNVANRTIDITNSNAYVTDPGTPESYNITNILPDIVGSHAIFTITCTAQGNTGATVEAGEYLIFKDSQDRKIVFYYRVAGVGSAPAVSAYLFVPVDVVSNATESQVASATSVAINSYLDFSTTVVGGNQIIFENQFNKINSIDSTWGSLISNQYTHPNTGFVLSITQPGTNNSTLGGKYFKIYDTNGSVAVWFNVYGESEPSHGADRSIQVVIPVGSSANDVGSIIANIINSDSEFTGSYSSNTLIIVNKYNANLSNGEAGTSGFVVIISNGLTTEYQTVTSAPGIRIFPLTSNDCQSIADFINNNSSVITASTVSSLESNKFIKCTKEELNSVSYGHSVGNSSIKLFDGESFVKTFQNQNPHFTIKKSLVLQGQSSYYNMMTCKNPDTEDLGEFFKLIPKTIKNIKHHLSHKALSQLPIVAEVDISDKFRKIQVKSKKLGTSGSVEVVGGRANIGEFSIFGDGENLSNTLKVKVSAYPSTINNGDVVKIYNEKPAKRYSRLSSTDTVTVRPYTNGDCDYIFNKKEINSYDFVKWTVTDISSEYGGNAASGYVYKWEHNDAGKNIKIQSKATGSALISPATRESDGDESPSPSALELFDVVDGSTTTKLTFNISVNSIPSQADYFIFQGSQPNSKVAIWFAVNDTTPPSSPEYLNSDIKIQVSILSTDSPNNIVDKIKSALNPISSYYSFIDENGISLEKVKPGDLLGVWADDPTSNNIFSFPAKLWSKSTGSGKISNYPIVKVDAVNRYMHVVNPKCEISNFSGTPKNGNIEVFPSVGIRWRFETTSHIKIKTITTAGTLATVITEGDHGFGTGGGSNNIYIKDTLDSRLNGSKSISKILSPSSFMFSITSGANTTYYGGVVIKNTQNLTQPEPQGVSLTQLKIESIGFNNLARISYVTDGYGDGSLRPSFKAFGVAVDDFVKISGSTFNSVNNGLFRVLGVSDEYVIIENPNCKEQINRFKKFNNRDISVTWQANSTQITGITGSFKYVATGDWVKKKEDEDYHLVQVIGFDTGNSETATILYLGSPYKGDDSISEGVAINQSLDSNTGIGKGVLLEDPDDIVFYSADSVLIGDSLVIESISNSSWFEASNSGIFTIKDFGTDPETKAQYVRVYNPDAISQTSVSLNLKPDGVYILESENYKYESVRKVKHTAISELNSNQRFIYMTPDHQSDKVSSVYGTKVKSLGKLDFEIGASSGIDGYSYYTGLLQTVQRIIDGYEPDSTTYPGRRAVGSLIEVLPPLIRSIRVSLDITTKEGVNLTEISNDIKSVIINYVNSLGVGKDVVHSEIIARIMAINGIDAATFTYPAASEERTAISDDEKAFISPESISLA